MQGSSDNKIETYVGAMVSNFKDRLAEHKADISKGNFNTALAIRAYEKDINVLWHEACVIKEVRDCKVLPTTEKIEILKGNKTGNIINIRQADGLSNAWKYAIKKCAL